MYDLVHTIYFDFVPIDFRFDESMVMLRRIMKWTSKDILYVKINTFKDESKKKRSEFIAQKEKSLSEYSEKIKSKYKSFARIDYKLYDHFSKKFERQVSQQDKDFEQEVKTFISIRHIFESFCENKYEYKETFVVGFDGHKLTMQIDNTSITVFQTLWSPSFHVSLEECSVIQTNEWDLQEAVKRWQVKRFNL